MLARAREQWRSDGARGALILALGTASGFAGPMLPFWVALATVVALALAALGSGDRLPRLGLVLTLLALGISGNAISSDWLERHLRLLPGEADLDRSYRIRARVLDDRETPYGWAISVDRVEITSPGEVPFRLARLTLYSPALEERPARFGTVEAWIRLQRARFPNPFPHPLRDLWERYRPRLTGSVKSTALLHFEPAGEPRASGLSAGNRELLALFFEGRPSYLWRERLQPFGLGHLLAISGLHCGFVFLGLQILLFPLRRPLTRSLLTAFGLLWFADWVGWTASVTRAAIILAVWQLLPLFDRQRSWLRLWAALALVLLLGDPLMLLSRGYWYSFAASLGLILALSHGRHGPCEHPWLKRARFALPILAAQLFVIPVNLMFGHTTALTDLVWNLFGIVALGLLAALTVIALLASWLPFLVPLANHAEGASATLLARATTLPDPDPLVRFPAEPALVLATLVGIALILWRLGREWRWYAAIALIAIFTLFGRPQTSDRLVMLDVGQGLCLLHVDEEGGATLFDAGGRLPPGTELTHLLALNGAKRLRAIFITHLDYDHYGFLEELPPVPVFLAETSLERARGDPVLGRFPHHGVRPGDLFAIGPYRLEALWPPPEARPPDDNENSLVLQLLGRDFSLLITGDAGQYVETRLGDFEAPGTRVLQVGHHGSRSASGLRFLSRYAPELALISCGLENRFGHPHPVVLSRLEALGARVRSTAREGSLEIAENGRLISGDDSGGDDPGP